MPSRNVFKVDIPDSYYHIYARGNSRDKIFLDEDDFSKFFSLLKRYLSKELKHDKYGSPYPNLYGQLELLCFCLMENHFHLMVYQHQEKAMQTLMRGVMSSYSRYFNKKYDRSGPVFETRYKASLISTQEYLMHVTRYIHLNRNNWQSTPYSSIGYYLDGRTAEWVRPNRILAMFSSTNEYKLFVADYADNQRMLDEIKYELANTITT